MPINKQTKITQFKTPNKMINPKRSQRLRMKVRLFQNQINCSDKLKQKKLMRPLKLKMEVMKSSKKKKNKKKKWSRIRKYSRKVTIKGNKCRNNKNKNKLAIINNHHNPKLIHNNSNNRMDTQNRQNKVRLNL